MLGFTAPQEDLTLVAAARWLHALLFGSLATTIAVVAVAALGFALLQGRLPLQRGRTVVVGCFLLFGAPTFAVGMRGTASALAGNPSAGPAEPAAAATPLAPPPAPPANYDPYAGASLIQ